MYVSAKLIFILVRKMHRAIEKKLQAIITTNYSKWTIDLKSGEIAMRIRATTNNTQM